MEERKEGKKEGRIAGKGKEGGGKEEKYFGDSLVIYSHIVKSSIFTGKQCGSATGNKEQSLFSYSDSSAFSSAASTHPLPFQLQPMDKQSARQAHRDLQLLANTWLDQRHCIHSQKVVIRLFA